MTRGNEPFVVALLAGVAAGLMVCAARMGAGAAAGGRAASSVVGAVGRWRGIWQVASREGGAAPLRTRRRLWLAGAVVGLLVGFSLLGLPGIVIGAAAGPYAMRITLKARRERFASQIDDCAAEFALALASALSGGNSVRGALLAAARATPEPLARELDRACVDLVLGHNLEDALAMLRERTASARIESLAGAIELHRNSGGDLVQLMRELAAAFRTRDIARRDAKAATAQARFTAVVVAAIPLTLGVVAELVSPGSVSGVFTFAPTAILMLLALVLLTSGCLMCARIGKVR